MITQMTKQTAKSRPNRFKVAAPILISALSLLIFATLAYGTHTHHTPAFDATTIHGFEAHQNPFLYKFMLFCSSLGGTWVIVGLTAIIFLYFAKIGRLKPDALVMLWATGAGLGLMEGMKHLFPRDRAYHIYDHLGSSFPSGHVLFALTVYGLLAHWGTHDSTPARKMAAWLGAIFVALLVGISRVYVGAHYPTDVIAGLSLGVPWLFGCLALLKRFGQKSR